MYRKSVEKVVFYLSNRIREWGNPDNAFVALSGGVDSAVVAGLLVEAFGKDRAITMYRNVRSNTKHEVDAEDIAKALGVRFLNIDGNPMYDNFLRQAKSEMKRNGDAFFDEGTPEVMSRTNFLDGYQSLKSRLTTPMAGFFSKVYGARIYGTGNIEEDLILRYFDKFGDGAVDYCPIVGLTKMEVRKIALYFAEKYSAEVFRRVAYKTPSADLQANGDAHNDENQLTSWAKAQGFDIQISYGDCEKEGNLAWACKKEIRHRMVTMLDNYLASEEFTEMGMLAGQRVDDKQIQLLRFLAVEEKKTRHKDFGLPGISRKDLMSEGLVD